MMTEPEGTVFWTGGRPVRFTGRTIGVEGREWYEVEILDGYQKGMTEHTKHSPEDIAKQKRVSSLYPQTS